MAYSEDFKQLILEKTTSRVDDPQSGKGIRHRHFLYHALETPSCTQSTSQAQSKVMVMDNAAFHKVGL
ncbi:hypothetical protein [uncultured Neisseria sp.]|uniref:hypothetical protein n=1 Tax=uncultured Neisseria sp. TaxID=237778 RepID=UPI002639FE9A|nr:hypothetical protein [uncultured Neisseria sp.]